MLTVQEARLLDLVIKNDEGGWVLSKDADGGDGGWTFGGITCLTYNEWCIKNGVPTANYNTIASMGDKTNLIKVCSTIYEQNYIVITRLLDSLDRMLLSAIINLGIHSFSTVLQRSLYSDEIAIDGVIGPQTVKAYHTDFNRSEFIYYWMEEYISICISNNSKLQFLKGWHRRIENYR